MPNERFPVLRHDRRGTFGRGVTAAAFLTCMLAAACSGSGGEDGGGANGGAAASADAAAGPVPDARGSGGGGSAQTDAARPPTPPGPDGAVAADASVAPPPEPDAVAVADAVVAPPPVPDAAVVADARGVPDAVEVPPDAAVVADARIVPDAVAIPPDAALAPDAVAIPSDAAVAPDATVAPDAAVVSPDAAVVEPPPDPDAPLPDLMAIPERTRDDMYFEEREFAPDSCALFEGCVGGPGLRRLLRFGVSTANVGNVDFEMGDPRETPELFQFSPCHGHFHFNDYARYALKDADGNTIAPGHKQAFCLLDSAIFVDWDPTVRQFPRYGCQFQGISRGWYDSYGSGLDCQWIDVTDVPPGDYELEVRINPERAIAELDYTNNDLRMTVTVPSFEMDVPCGPADDAGPDRMCGWRIGAVGECAPGELVDAGCAQAGNDCADAVCPEQPFMRACAGEAASCMAPARPRRRPERVWHLPHDDFPLPRRRPVHDLDGRAGPRSRRHLRRPHATPPRTARRQPLPRRGRQRRRRPAVRVAARRRWPRAVPAWPRIHRRVRHRPQRLRRRRRLPGRPHAARLPRRHELHTARPPRRRRRQLRRPLPVRRLRLPAGGSGQPLRGQLPRR
jgi:hypothetical protein